MWFQFALTDPEDRIDYGLNTFYVPDLDRHDLIKFTKNVNSNRAGR